MNYYLFKYKMPFVSKSQARACYAIRRRNPKSKWNCDEWAKSTDWKRLPESAKKSVKRKSRKSNKRRKSGRK